MKIHSLVSKMLVFMISMSILFMSTAITVFCEENVENTTEGIVVQDGGYVDPNMPTTAYIFLGDSRFVGMNKYTNMGLLPNTYVVAKVGKGYDWLEKTALAEINTIKATTTYEKYIIICNLGVNDLGNINKYVSILPLLCDDNTTLYWVSVNPTIDSLSSVKCKNIEGFNATLKQFIPELNWVDSYTYLTVDGFKAHDGVHYDAETYTKLFYYIMSYVVNVEYARNNPQSISDS